MVIYVHFIYVSRTLFGLVEALVPAGGKANAKHIFPFTFVLFVIVNIHGYPAHTTNQPSQLLRAFSFHFEIQFDVNSTSANSQTALKFPACACVSVKASWGAGEYLLCEKGGNEVGFVVAIKFN